MVTGESRVCLNNYCRPDEVFQQYQTHIPTDIYICSHGPLPPSPPFTTHSLKAQDIHAMPLSSTEGICGLGQTICAWIPPLHPQRDHHRLNGFWGIHKSLSHLHRFQPSSSTSECRSSSHRKYWGHRINCLLNNLILWLAIYQQMDQTWLSSKNTHAI